MTGSGPLSEALRAFGFTTFAAVAEHTRRIPYGRVAARDDVLAVIHSPRGTCSSKHRLLAALAHECGHPDVHLTVGLYEMTERNTPGVGSVLAAAGIEAIPEAHCYLTHQGVRYDFTGLPGGAASPFDALIEERVIAPDELVGAKERYHREVLARWAVARGLDPATVWNVRERCIERLSSA